MQVLRGCRFSKPLDLTNTEIKRVDSSSILGSKIYVQRLSQNTMGSISRLKQTDPTSEHSVCFLWMLRHHFFIVEELCIWRALLRNDWEQCAFYHWSEPTFAGGKHFCHINVLIPDILTNMWEKYPLGKHLYYSHFSYEYEKQMDSSWEATPYNPRSRRTRDFLLRHGRG